MAHPAVGVTKSLALAKVGGAYLMLTLASLMILPQRVYSLWT